MRKLTSLLCACALTLVLATGAMAATINIQNNDGAGEGFNDPTVVAPVGGNPGTTVGAQRLNAFTYAANIWGACLQSAVPITIAAQMNPLSCTASSAVLGSAGTISVFRDFPGAPLSSTWYPGALANALAGFDLDPSTPEISAQFNSNIGNVGCLTGTFWYYGLDHNPPAGTIDFVTVVLHEMGHGLGFQTFISSAGAKFLGFDDDYEVYLEQHGATPSWFPLMSDAQRAAGQISDPNLHWTGPIVTNAGLMRLSAGMVGGHVQMHGPNPFQPGSSTSHWSTALTPNELMEPVYTGGNHEPGMAWALLDEVGWSLCSQPENGCNAAVLDLSPATGTLNSATIDNNQERGTFITALKDFNVCSLGISADLVPGQTITANIYAASGTTRGALLASASTTVKFDGERVHYVPISYTLQKCKEYDIAIAFQTNNFWHWWDETTITQRPYDIGGVIRVRDGDLGGNASNFALAHFQIRGTSASAEAQANMVVSATGPVSLGPEHGAFITMKKTVSLSKLGVSVGYANAPSVLRAYVYNASGNVRGTLVAEGIATVPTTAVQLVTVPINALLQEGKQYDIGFDFGTNSTRFTTNTPTPWTFGSFCSVDVVEQAGSASAIVPSAIPTFQMTYSDGTGLNGLDVVGPWLGTPTGTSSGGFAFGKYIQAVATQDMTGAGFYADIPPGQTVTVNVYNATSTPSRGTLISTGTIASNQTGTTWHDVPVSVRMTAGQYYDVEFVWSAANAFPFWAGVSSQPYTAYGIVKMIIGEFGGTPDGLQECTQVRYYSCPVGSLTAVGPTTTPKFALHEAFPNPFSGTTTIGYELDEAATVSVQVYDVAGRKVADVVKSRAMTKGPGQLTFDAGNLVSGVYFVKMSTPSKSVTRKITIVH